MDQTTLDAFISEKKSSLAERTETWESMVALLAVADAIREEGAITVVKVDGERSSKPYTVVISGGRLDQDFFRRDGEDVSALLQEGLAEYLGR